VVAGNPIVRACPESLRSAVEDAVWGAFLPLGLVFNVVGLDRVRASDRCCLVGSGDLVVPYGYVATASHSPGKVAMSRGHLAF
jgi:hypothetical protein